MTAAQGGDAGTAARVVPQGWWPVWRRALANWFDAFPRDILFQKEEFHNHENGSPFMARWTLFTLGGCALYVHKFFASDCRAPHDHPRRFLTIGLKGRYFERRYHPQGHSHEGDVAGLKQYRAPWVRCFAATHTHWQEMIPGEVCWTLAFVFPKSREWGFWEAVHDFAERRVRNRWVPWRDYIRARFGFNDRSSGPPAVMS